jgi:hypothetical protein
MAEKVARAAFRGYAAEKQQEWSGISLRTFAFF